ncbi:hypothetical protein EKO23_07650 [Nocardioides guangzhouensis]|uniref:Uncharacterized protein n=1 Tax=Nocardioides guangzhouensis TaxID=2497878 RepID=A0A4Q4ZFD7_9ACTN|nr:hypothetical protein [Nocardioides guangzhouensis]RYP86842.1 hypothetical protein EKO23_07650 [Nocardioides guangzhouensis]
MSRTEKTSPYLVKLWDGTLRRVAEHDHRFGDCDLPQTLAEHRARCNSRCRWELRYDGTHICCCQLCRAQTWVRNDLRGERNRARIRLGEALKEYRGSGDWED